MQHAGHETIFTLEMTPIKFGAGAAEETGWELKRLGVRRVMLVSDPGIVRAGITEQIQPSIEAAGVECVAMTVCASSRRCNHCKKLPISPSRRESMASSVSGADRALIPRRSRTSCYVPRTTPRLRQ